MSIINFQLKSSIFAALIVDTMLGRLKYLLVALILLAGCRQQQADLPRLVELDSLIAVAPDSAAALLEAIPADSLPTAADRAYHALLLTQAK